MDSSIEKAHDDSNRVAEGDQENGKFRDQMLLQKLKTNLEIIENYKKWHVKSPSKLSVASDLAVENDILQGQILRREQMVKVLRRFIYTHLIEKFQNSLSNIPIYNATKVSDFINYEDSLVLKLQDDNVNLEIKYQNVLYDLQQMQFRNNLEKQAKDRVINEYHSTDLNFRDNIKRLEGEKRSLNVLLKLRSNTIEEERQSNYRLNEELDLLRYQYDEQIEISRRLKNELLNKEAQINELNKAIEYTKSIIPPPEIKIIEKIKEPTREQVDKHFLLKYDTLVKELDNLVKEGVFFENDYDKIHGIYSKYATRERTTEVEAKLRNEIELLNNSKLSFEEKFGILQEKYADVNEKVVSLTSALDEKNEHINMIESRLGDITLENNLYQEQIIEIKRQLSSINNKIADEIELIIRKKKDQEVQTNSTIDCSKYHDNSYEVTAVKISTPREYKAQFSQTINPKMKSTDAQTCDNSKSFTDISCQTNESDQELPIEASILSLLESVKDLVKYTLPSEIYFKPKIVEPQEFVYFPKMVSSTRNIEEDYKMLIHKKILTKVIKVADFLPGNDLAALRLKRALIFTRDLTYLRNKYVMNICQNSAFSTSNTRQLIRCIDLVIQSVSYLLLPESYHAKEGENNDNIRQYVLNNDLSFCDQDDLDFSELSALFSNSNVLDESAQPFHFDHIGAHRGIISGKYMNRSDSPRTVRPNTSGTIKINSNPVKMCEANDTTIKIIDTDYHKEFKIYETGDVTHLEWAMPWKVRSPSNERPASSSPTAARKTVVTDNIMQELLLTSTLNSPRSPLFDSLILDQRRAFTATSRARANKTKKLSFENPNTNILRPQRPFSSNAALETSDGFGLSAQRVDLKSELSKREKVTGAKLAFL